MKQLFIFFSFGLLFTSCVSRKKYLSLKEDNIGLQDDNSDLIDVVKKVNFANDSLKKQISFLDSLLRIAGTKNNSSSGAISSDASNKAKAAPVISKTVEYDKKALYIYNIPNYIFWPTTVKTDKFLIGIIGESKMNSALGAFIYGKNIRHLPSFVEPYSPAPGKFYHMVFISEGKQKEFQKIKKELKDQPVLLLVENQSLEKMGAHVSFYVEGEKIKFNINKKLIEKSGMNVSDQLIKLSQAN